MAPAIFNVSDLERERRMHEAEVARASRHASSKRAAAGGKGLGLAGSAEQSSAMASLVLRAAHGRLASTQAALADRARDGL